MQKQSRLWLLVLLCAIMFNTAKGQIFYKEDIIGSCPRKESIRPVLFKNLSRYFCLVKCEIIDSTAMANTRERIGTVITEHNNEYQAGEDWVIDVIYSFDQHRDIILFFVWDQFMDRYFNVAFNRKLNKYYLLDAINMKGIGELLSTEDFFLHEDYQILEYCYLITFLDIPFLEVKPLVSINELLYDAIFNNPMLHNTQNVRQYERIEVEMPRIERNWERPSPVELHKMIPGQDTVRATFYVAFGNKIERVSVSLSGIEILVYNSTFIGETLDWYGVRHMIR